MIATSFHVYRRCSVCTFVVSVSPNNSSQAAKVLELYSAQTQRELRILKCRSSLISHFKNCHHQLGLKGMIPSIMYYSEYIHKKHAIGNPMDLSDYLHPLAAVPHRKT